VKVKNVENAIFCDASGAGFAGFIEGDDTSHVIGLNLKRV
jgi:hypothetical protein